MIIGRWFIEKLHSMSPYSYPGIPLSDRNPAKITPDDIIAIVCDHYQIPREVLSVKKRTHEIVLARYMVWMMIKRYIKRYSLQNMGLLFGDFDHTTVLHGLKVLPNWQDTDADISKDVATISRRINNGA